MKSAVGVGAHLCGTVVVHEDVEVRLASVLNLPLFLFNSLSSKHGASSLRHPPTSPRSSSLFSKHAASLLQSSSIVGENDPLLCNSSSIVGEILRCATCEAQLFAELVGPVQW